VHQHASLRDWWGEGVTPAIGITDKTEAGSSHRAGHVCAISHQSHQRFDVRWSLLQA
jgi:hypothetical protein